MCTLCSARTHFLAALAAEGVAAARVDVLPLTVSTADHLGLYAAMDISLDPFPYAGTTTTCESLFMGVPVVTLAGELHGQHPCVMLREGWRKAGSNCSCTATRPAVERHALLPCVHAVNS